MIGSFTLQFSWGLVYWVSDPFVCMAMFFWKVFAPNSPKNVLGLWRLVPRYAL